MKSLLVFVSVAGLSLFWCLGAASQGYPPPSVENPHRSKSTDEEPQDAFTAGTAAAAFADVKRCWHLGQNSPEAQRTVVVISVEMNRDGTPQNNTIRLIRSNNAGSEAERIAFEAARRAIIRCGARGFPLPPEKFGRWQDIEMTFNPESMRTR